MKLLIARIGKFWRSRKGRRVRWVYLALIPAFVGGLVVVFDFHLVKHIFLALGCEFAIHHLAAMSVVEKVAEAAEEVV